MRIKINRPRLLQQNGSLRSPSETSLEQALTHIKEAIDQEYCPICKEWIDRVRMLTEDCCNRIEYNHALYKLKRQKGIITPWNKLDLHTKTELKEEVKRKING